MKTNNTSNNKLTAAARLGANRVFPISGTEGYEGINFREWLASLIWVEMQNVVPCGDERRWARVAVQRAEALLLALAEAEPSQAKPATLRLTGEPPFPPPPLVEPGPDPLPEDVFDLDSLERGGTDE
jgi:hypothetical protein